MRGRFTGHLVNEHGARRIVSVEEIAPMAFKRLCHTRYMYNRADVAGTELSVYGGGSSLALGEGMG